LIGGEINSEIEHAARRARAKQVREA